MLIQTINTKFSAVLNSLFICLLVSIVTWFSWICTWEYRLCLSITAIFGGNLISSTGYLNVCMYACLFNWSHTTIQATALKLWHNIPHVYNSSLFFSNFWKIVFPELLPFFYISLRFLCKFEEQLRKNKWR